MERSSNEHNPRIDDEMAREVASLVHGAPMESRVEESRTVEDPADGEPVPEPVIIDDAFRDRTELARHLRPSIFPADRDVIVECAIEEHAPDTLIDALRGLPDTQYRTTNEVWVALGGTTEHREAAPAAPPFQHFDFRFDWRYRLAALPFGVIPSRAFVEIDRRAPEPMFRARFGWWEVETPLANIAGVQRSGPYAIPKTIGPAHLSIMDQGLTFATTNAKGLCIQFHEPVPAIDPLGIVHHPALTVTPDDLDALEAALQH